MAKKKALPKHRIGRVTIRKRGNIWWARYTPYANAKFTEESLRCRTYEEASRKAQEIDQLLERGDTGQLDDRKTGQRLTYQAMVDEFLANYTGWNDSTRKGALPFIKILSQEWGTLPLHGLTPRLMGGYLAQRLDSGSFRPGTHNRYLSFLRRLFAMAVDYGYLHDNPAQKIAFVKEEQKIPEALTPDQVEALLKEAAPHIQPIIILAVDTGLRRAELYAMTWADVDFARREIRIPKSKIKKFRVIPMTERVYALLSERKKAQAQEKIQDLRVIPFVDIKKGLARAGQRAGIGHVHLHMLRHTFATELLDHEVSLDRIQALLGHKSVVVTQRYAKTRPTQLHDAIAQLNPKAS